MSLREGYILYTEASKKYGLTVGSIRTYQSKGRISGQGNSVCEASLVEYLEKRQRKGHPKEEENPMVRKDQQLTPERRAQFWASLNAIAGIPEQ